MYNVHNVYYKARRRVALSVCAYCHQCVPIVCISSPICPHVTPQALTIFNDIQAVTVLYVLCNSCLPTQTLGFLPHARCIPHRATYSIPHTMTYPGAYEGLSQQLSHNDPYKEGWEGVRLLIVYYDPSSI